MAKGDIEGGAQVGDGVEKIVGILRMLAHLFPFRFIQRARFSQDLVRDTHFADIVQEHAAADVCDLAVVDVHAARQADGQVGDAPRVPLCLLVAQFKSFAPAFQCGIVGKRKFLIGALEVFEHLGIVDGDGGLTRNGLHELQPVIIGDEGARKNSLKHSFNLSFAEAGDNPDR